MGFIDDIRVTKNSSKYTWADNHRCIYKSVLPWNGEMEAVTEFGRWGEWFEIPFLFIPKRNYDNEWVWGRGIKMRIMVIGVSFTRQTVDAEIMYDRPKNIFTRKLQGVE